MAALEPRDRDVVAEPPSVDLVDYWLAVRRRWVLVLVTALLGAALGLGYTIAAGPTYSATSQVLVAPVTQGPLNMSAQVNLLVNMSTEQAVAQSAPVIAQAAKLTHTRPAELQALAAKRLTVAVPTTSDVLQITWQAPTAGRAQAGANAFAEAYLMYRHAYLAGQVAGLESVLSRQVSTLQDLTAHVSAQLNRLSAASAKQQSLKTRLSQLNGQLYTTNKLLASLPTYNDSGGRVIPSALPLAATGLRRSVILAMGAFLGLVVGLVVAFIRDVFDDRVHDGEQLERVLRVATLAVLPGAGRTRIQLGKGGRMRGSALATVADRDSRAAEEVRMLRATLVAVATRQNMRILLIAGADASVSPGRIAAELGVALAESGRRVLLVAADMRGSALPQVFGLRNDTGLGDLLTGAIVPAGELIRRPREVAGIRLDGAVSERLAVLPPGPRLPHALSLLDSAAMARLLEDQRNAYDFVVLDSPPAAVAADVFVLAPQVDGVMVMARGARTRCRALIEMRRRLNYADARMIGGLLIAGAGAGRYWQGPTGPASVRHVPDAGPKRAEVGHVSRHPKPLPVTPNVVASRSPGKPRELLL